MDFDFESFPDEFKISCKSKTDFNQRIVDEAAAVANINAAKTLWINNYIFEEL